MKNIVSKIRFKIANLAFKYFNQELVTIINAWYRNASFYRVRIMKRGDVEYVEHPVTKEWRKIGRG